MLFLKPPFHIIEGVAVFADHANERQFYYLPAMPRLTTVRDPALGVDVPQIQLLKFRGSAGTGGFLSFEVNLGVDQDRLDAVAAELRRLFRLDDPPILAPAVLEDGTVRLMILGQESPAAPAGGAGGTGGPRPAPPAEPPRFVVKIEHAAKPALYGDNQAIFSVSLDQDGVQLVEDSLKGEMLPIGVIYALDFYALRPAFTVKVTADWDRVQKHFDESFKVDTIIFSSQIDKVVDELVESQAVLIEVDSFLPEGEDAGSWVGRRDQALNDFKDMVLDNFFKPSLEPIREEKDGWDRFADTTERLALLAATGGWAGVASFSYTKRDITRIDRKRLNLVMTERVTVKRSIYPQAHLKGLGRLLRAPGVDLARFVRAVTLDDPWFKKRQVKAHALVNFDNDNVDSVNVTATYGGIPQTMRLTKAEPSAAREWLSVLDNGAMRRPVEYEYRVNFRDVDTAERPGVLTAVLDPDGKKLATVGDEFDLSPRAAGLYYQDDIVFGADALPWERYPSVAVEVLYDDPDNGVRLAETFLLNKSKPEAVWKRFRRNPVRDSYQVKVTYLAVDHRDVVFPWQPTTQERFIIRNPRPSKQRTLQVLPQVNWALVAVVFVELRYVDEANGVDEQQTLSFFDNPQDRGPKTFTASIADGTDQMLVRYTATILLKDNRAITVPPSATAGTIVAFRTDTLGHRIVAVRPGDADFAARGLVRIEAQLAYTDPESGLNFQDRFTFLSSKDSRFFEYDYAAAERNAYTCTVTFVMANGLVQERELGRLNGDRLILPTT
jgi:hypothetical protein